MQITKAKKRLGAALLAACLLVALAFGGVSAYAANAGTGPNTLTVNVQSDSGGDVAKADAVNADVVVNVYRIGSAEYISSYDTYDYAFDVDPFTGLKSLYTPASMTGAKWQELANEAAKLVKKATPVASNVAVGEEITGLENGLYLVVAPTAFSNYYEYTFNPTIVSLPTKEPLKDSSGQPIKDADGYPIVASSQQYGGWINKAEIQLKPEPEPLYGSLLIDKQVQKVSGNVEPATFVFHVTGKTLEGEDFERYGSVYYTGGPSAPTTITHIPAGSVVTVSESYEGARYKLVKGDDEPKTIVAERIVEAEGSSTPMAKAVFVNEPDGTTESGHGIENNFRLDKEGDGEQAWDWRWTAIPEDSKANPES